ncbi:pirin family protein [Novosphingobium sp.]|uniref:pirin family protein n=1 Tax=Novosphingobium sp. TaxID=1874826 RepID=UPI00286CDD90|nr:pirin family protein [Novosphingobium sp.]
MIELRPFSTIGAANHGWLDAHHHFSFGGYHDPARTHWGALRVWNDDVIAANSGFPPHAHDNMEIITYVREGAISHKDSLGNQGRTGAGDVQVMSAGTGIQHAEFNLEDEDCTLFQIWIMPDRTGHPPSWGTRPFPKQGRDGQFVTLASGLPQDAEALKINTSSRVAGAFIKAGETVRYETAPVRHLYLVPATGKVRIGAVEAQARDGVAITGESAIAVTALEDSEVVLVDAA